MEHSKRILIGKRRKRNFLPQLLTVILVIGMIFSFSACGDGPAGAEGPQGPEGPEGPIGPAGEDGSVIYADEGEPGDDIGDIGDYYLNQNTGELYGPKDEDGWGEPIIVLMGGDGTDGEDGNVIHSGEGAPDVELGKIGDFYFDESSGEFYGPKTEDGWGSPTDLTGEDGEDGSVIHSGEGAPGEDIGAIADYYLDKSTGELYGPKTESGWGDPIDLTGEDGQDGEDGSQIHSGSGEPDEELAAEGDFYLDRDSYDLYGPKTSDGWGTPLNLKGADGNANVTRYIFPGHDFSDGDHTLTIADVTSQAEMYQSTWLVYLVAIQPSGIIYHPVPGYGLFGDTEYRVEYKWLVATDEASFDVKIVDGTGDGYTRIEIIRIEYSETVDNRKQNGDSIIPDHLDTSNYQEVADYYGFYNK